MTGGSGLVGKAIETVINDGEKAENEEWVYLSSKDANLLELASTRAVFKKHRPTHVIHLAAMVSQILQSWRYQYFETFSVAGTQGFDFPVSCSET